MVNHHLILKEYWWCADAVPHRHPLHEVTLITISSSSGARIRKKKGAALPRCCTGTFCKVTGEGLDVRILDSASEFGSKWWTWFSCFVPSAGALQQFCFNSATSSASTHWDPGQREEMSPGLSKSWVYLLSPLAASGRLPTVSLPSWQKRE